MPDPHTRPRVPTREASPRNRRRRLAGAGVAFATLVVFSPDRAARAQELSRVGVDSVVAIDQFVGENAADRPNIIVDVSAVVRLGGGWRAFVRPWFRQPRTPVWNKEIYQAMLQYERPGNVGVRVDLGYLASPFGLGMMDTRPGVNPTIAGHAAYFTPLPVFDRGLPRVQAIASTYPLGGQVTVSTKRWDARGALVGSTPVRMYVINRAGNAGWTPTVEGGGGVTLGPGLRIGGAMARGPYAADEELPPTFVGDPSVTLAALEGDLAVGHTRVSGEVIHGAYDAAGRTVHAYTWFIQGARTLSPRWFVAGRHEGVSAPPAVSGVLAGRRSTLAGVEEAVGYRLTTDLTLRGGLYQRKTFTRADWDQQAGVSLVWARRWW